ncbi:hypothetical protein A2866_04135 [Candidatus Roizmanbacteria bacterium RIFCSPHIGHO2_01_FULL_39_8]|uniref:Aspartyl/glutamyl-tRNA(Asn/Gln) amidotransferase subunit B n=2 Tax=Candidatus Roizmaniibacteriota TaxID=1752723 RepID=A0A1F7GFF7_9BACT|nr:MAG: hypothetical protein A2866_04135 [Candidatus Roizmanbacteria bacterium RIFCSPHIGHO2_01_FULL_39_8]OGK35760.1 MAG: hypothetical protein A3F60_01600 [Candidatus Roizmanbacteria bacterium RIFCSPHIGHO2_12_FULL_39_8]
MTKYTPVIGLEIHIELKTLSKTFCGCRNDPFNAKEPNIYTCPVCLGLPGALPVPNKKAIEWTMLLGKALNCKINTVSKFDRKHYFYPDLPKGYQISQYDEPIASQGWVKIKNQISNSKDKSNEEKKIRIHRVHLEEDTGKLMHSGVDTLIDFNRSGVPLVEVVTEADFDNSDDVKAFLIKLHNIIVNLGVSDANMEKGSMRLEPNISVRKADQKTLPSYKVEVKNINSFNFVKKAIDYEVERHIEILERDEIPTQETRGFVEKTSSTVSQRSKEEAHDYRYFPEPDIPPLEFEQEYIDSIKVPELADDRKQTLMQAPHNLEENLAENVSLSKAVTDYYLSVFTLTHSHPELSGINVAKTLANLILNKKLFQNYPDPQESAIYVIETIKPKKTDMKLLGSLIERVIASNKKTVEDYNRGKENAIMYLVGQVMKEMKGKADPLKVKEALLKKLKKE